MPRQARLDAPGTLHHVMIRGTERQRIFREDKDRQHFLSQIARISEDTGARILAWVLMDSHILKFSGPKQDGAEVGIHGGAGCAVSADDDGIG